MLVTRAAHHLLMLEAASTPRQAMMTCSNAMQHLRNAGIDNSIRTNVGNSYGATRTIDWRIEKDPGKEDAWLHARLKSAKEPLEWRIDDDTISLGGIPESLVLGYRERLQTGPFPATDVVQIPFISGRYIQDIDASSMGAILVMTGSHRDDAVSAIPQSLGEWRNAGIAYERQLQDGPVAG